MIEQYAKNQDHDPKALIHMPINVFQSTGSSFLNLWKCHMHQVTYSLVLP